MPSTRDDNRIFFADDDNPAINDQHRLLSNTSTEQPPPDSYNGVWFIFVAFGIGLLLPWNVFLTAYSHFARLFPDLEFEYIFSVTYNAPNIVTMILLLVYGSYFSFRTLLLTGFVLDLVALAAVIPVGLWLGETASLYCTLLIVAITGVAAAILFGSVMALAAFFPPRYSAAIMVGNGISGMAVVLLQIVSITLFDPSTDEGDLGSSLVYFLSAATMVFIVIALYMLLIRSPFTRYYMANYEFERLAAGKPKRKKLGAVVPVMRKIWFLSLELFLVFFVTLCVYPGVVTGITQTTPWIPQFPLTLIGLFVICDSLGRVVPRWTRLGLTARWLWLPTTLRIAFLVVFPLCIKPRIFDNDAWVYVFVALMALSNGFLGTLCFMFAPPLVDMDEKETVGIIMSFSLNAGIFAGGVFAILMLYLLEGHI